MSNKSNYKPAVLCILDGWGNGEPTETNAVHMAKTPNWSRLALENPTCNIKTCGLDVGLPHGQMGNSEVGHTNIGAGRVIFQDLQRITNTIDDGSFAQNPAFLKVLDGIKKDGGTLHIMGLVSDGGIHSHIKHIIATIELFSKAGVSVKLHCFSDGRDTSPKSFNSFLTPLVQLQEKFSNFEIVTICGRYYAMDRDKRYERLEIAYKAVACGEAQYNFDDSNILDVANSSYKREQTDEFILPHVKNGYKGIQNGDSVLLTNFRADRVRQISHALFDDNFTGFKRDKLHIKHAVGMTSYSKDLNALMDSAFPSEDLNNTLGEVVSKAGLKQLHAAETEKYPHVTFFINGGREQPFEGEDRILVPSPKVATYDLQPEMSAFELSAKVCEALATGEYSLGIINFANGDMVGHTGSLSAAIKAVEAVDKCIGQIEEVCKKIGATLFITADHGNCEEMWDYKNNMPHTAHTTNLVTLIAVNHSDKFTKLNDGRLANLAPSILEEMGLEVPSIMSDKSLLVK